MSHRILVLYEGRLTADRGSEGISMIRILVADDHAIVRAGLKQFIADLRC